MTTASASGFAGRQLAVHHARRRELLVRDRTIVVLDAGGTAERPPTATLVMVPGYTGAKEDFAPLLDPLVDNGFRVLAVDLPGQHESPGPARESEYSVDALGAVVHGLLEQISGPVVLLGHSFGGLVARAAVLAGARPSGLVLFSSGPAALPDGPRARLITGGESVLRTRGLQVFWDMQQQVLAAAGGPRAGLPVELTDYFRRRFLCSSPAGLLGMGRAILDEPDRVDELATALARRGIGILVTSGEADDAWGLPLQAEMARRLGTALVPIPGAAHSAAVEAPEALLQVLMRHVRAWTGQ